jgi:hypothetical protein
MFFTGFVSARRSGKEKRKKGVDVRGDRKACLKIEGCSVDVINHCGSGEGS